MLSYFFFFFNDTATTEIYTLSLHDALPISFGSSARISASASSWRCSSGWWPRSTLPASRRAGSRNRSPRCAKRRSEEHTSELQSQSNLVCRLLLEKKKKKKRNSHSRVN